MKHFKRLGLLTPEARQAPFAEFDARTKRWRIWQSFTPHVDGGTYLDLYPTGQVDRVTVLNGWVAEIVILSGERDEEVADQAV